LDFNNFWQEYIHAWLLLIFLQTESPHIHPTKVAAKKVFNHNNVFFFNEFAFTVQVKHK